jgi:hypothetical protein
VTSLPWFHPRNVYDNHRKALELMVEVLEAAVKDALPEARRRHPHPGAVPGDLLSPLVRDSAKTIALSSAYSGQTLRAAHTNDLRLHLLTADGVLRIRVRKMRGDPEQPVPLESEPELFPVDYTSRWSLFGEMVDLALFWVVEGEALYRAVLAAPAGWDDDTSLCTWYGAVELHAPAARTLVWPLPDTNEVSSTADADDLDDVILPQARPGEEREAPGDVG